MAKLNISQAARTFGKDRSTIQRHAKQGKLSWEIDSNGHKLIDMSELIQQYGEPKKVAAGTTVQEFESIPQRTAPDATPIFEEKISMLEEQIKELRDDKQDLKKERDKLLGIVHQQTLQLEDKREKKGFWSRVFGR